MINPVHSPTGAEESVMETNKRNTDSSINVPLHDAFFEAVRSRDETRALDLLNRDPTIANAKRIVQLPGHTCEKPFTALIAAADQDMEGLVDALIKAGADIASQYCKSGGTALHMAAWHGNSNVVRVLLDHGAPIEIRCEEFNGTPLGWAVHGSSPHAWTGPHDQAGAAKMLIAAGANVNLDGLLKLGPPEEMVRLLKEAISSQKYTST